MLQLSNKWSNILITQPETGMGYQVASVVLQDGRRYDQVIIIGGYITQIHNFKNIPFEEKDIVKIIITHDKWNWRHEHM